VAKYKAVVVIIAQK